MSDPLFMPRREHGSALDQLRNLRDMARGGAAADAVAPLGDDVAEAAAPLVDDAVAAAPVEAFAAGAVAEPAAQYVDDAAAQVGAAVAGNDPDALARAAQAAAAAGAADPAAQQVLDVAVQPRLIIQGQAGPIVVPVDVAVPAAQARVSIQPAIPVVVDPLTGQAVATGNAAAATPQAAAAAPDVAAAPRQGLRTMSAEDIGSLFRRGGAAGGAVEVADAVQPSLIERLRGAAAGVAPVADEAAPVADEGVKGLAAVREGLAGLGALRKPAAADAIEAAVAKAPSLADRALDALRVASKVSPKG